MGSPVFVGFQRILVAFDASAPAEHAIDVALSMAGDMKAKLFVVAVIRPPKPAENPEFNAVLEDGRERYESSFVPIRERAKWKDIDLETDIAVGHPAEQIIHRAETIQASLIVMGKRKHTILHRWISGSNSDCILKYAQCPVMVVH
jgi:nucleotide-binding universal stress UspA family protein